MLGETISHLLVLFVFLPALGVASLAIAEEEDVKQTAEEKFGRLSAYVRKTMAETAVPGVAVGVLHDGESYTAGFGVTNVEHPLEVTVDTLFLIGSITKTMTGTVMMRLVEQGKLDLDAPVRKYLPDFKVQDEEATAKAKVKDLLTHMGGWVGDHFNSTGEGDDALDRMMEEMADLEQLAPIGTVWSYNNSGFYVAGKIIEVVTGKSYEEVLQELILDAIGLSDTYIKPADVMTKRYVVGHTVSDDGIEIAQPWPLYRAAYPAGGAITNVKDMLTYAAFHMGDGTNADGERIMKEESLEVMQVAHAPKVGTDDLMGLTWHLSDLDSKRTVAHGGGTSGQISLLLMIPEEDFALAIVTNANRGGDITRKVSRWILEHYVNAVSEDPEPRESTPDELAQYVGTYSRPFMDITVSLEEGKLMVQPVIKQGFMNNEIPPPTPPMEFGMHAVDRIIQIDGTRQAQFIRKADGSIGWLRVGGRIHIRQ